MPATRDRGIIRGPLHPSGSPPLPHAPLAPRLLFWLLAAFTLTPWASPPLALALGAALGLAIGNPYPKPASRASRLLLQACVVGLGFGMSIASVVAAGGTGVGVTAVVITGALALGMALGRWLRVDAHTSLLISAGTSICGGSAIAAVGPAIGARDEAMGVSLATVFVLNAVALLLFPPLGRLLGLDEAQFAVWAAVAIHDTSSVVGAAASYGPGALAAATVLKLVRALWIIPLTLAAAAYARARFAGTAGEARPRLPWFIALFVLAAAARSGFPTLAPAFDVLAHAARVGLALVLFLIGAGLSRSTLRAVGVRPLLQGVLLWMAVGAATLLAVWGGHLPSLGSVP